MPEATGEATERLDAAISRLRGQLLGHWQQFPQAAALERLLRDTLERAMAATPETMTVTSPVSRVARLKLAPLGDAADLDSFYHGEAAELALSEQGRCYLVYRRRDGGSYAVEWSSATLMPENLMRALPEVLALAMFEGDDHD